MTKKSWRGDLVAKCQDQERWLIIDFQYLFRKEEVIFTTFGDHREDEHNSSIRFGKLARRRWRLGENYWITGGGQFLWGFFPIDVFLNSDD